MTMISQIGLFVLAGLLIVAGISHFMKPRFYARMLPLWLPAHKFLVASSGLAEIILGLGLLYAPSRIIAAWATIVMLVLFLIVHVHMAIGNEAGLGLPKWALWLRVLFQFILIGWILTYTM